MLQATILTSSDFGFWVKTSVLLILFVLLIFGKVRNGRMNHYFNSSLSESFKKNLALFHGFMSLILALIFPSFYLNEVSFFNELYRQSEVWMTVSSIALIFVFIPILGEFLSFSVRLVQEKKPKDRILRKND